MAPCVAGWRGSARTCCIEELLFKTQHGLIDQSLHSRMGAETTNGDGFGLGWYGEGDGPGRLPQRLAGLGRREPARAGGAHQSPLFLAHVRATTGGAIQQTNCHPFRHGKWLFVHNGLISDFDLIHRELVLGVEPELFPSIAGSTDSEVLFHVALSNGLEDDPIDALEAAIGLAEETRPQPRPRAGDPGEHRRQRRNAAMGGALRDLRAAAHAVRLVRRGQPATAASR